MFGSSLVSLFGKPFFSDLDVSLSAVLVAVVANALLVTPDLAPSFTTWAASRSGLAIDCLAAIVHV